MSCEKLQCRGVLYYQKESIQNLWTIERFTASVFWSVNSFNSLTALARQLNNTKFIISVLLRSVFHNAHDEESLPRILVFSTHQPHGLKKHRLNFLNEYAMFWIGNSIFHTVRCTPPPPKVDGNVYASYRENIAVGGRGLVGSGVRLHCHCLSLPPPVTAAACHHYCHSLPLENAGAFVAVGAASWNTTNQLF